MTQGARDIPGHRIGHLRLLRALQDPELTVQKLETLIQHDASLCYRVLRTVNSAAFGQSRFYGVLRGPTSPGRTWLLDVTNVSVTPYT